MNDGSAVGKSNNFHIDISSLELNNCDFYFANNVGDNQIIDFKTPETPIVESSFPENLSNHVSVYTVPHLTFNQFMDPVSFIPGETVLVSCIPNP